MLRHIMYAAFAVLLGIAVMILPLMTYSRHVEFMNSGQPQLGEAENAFASSDEERTAGNITSKGNFSITAAQGYERLTSKVISSLPYAMLIVAMGLAAATAVLLLAKRRLL